MRLTNETRDIFIRAAMSDVPKTDYQSQAVEIAREWLASEMEVLFPGVDLVKAKPWLNETALRMPGSLQCFFACAPDYDHLKTDPKLWAVLVEISKKLDRQNEKLHTLKEQLRGCAYSVTTVKALAGLLPEFAHYLPSESNPARMLPATTGVVDAFRSAGWPKQPQTAVSK